MYLQTIKVTESHGTTMILKILQMNAYVQPGVYDIYVYKGCDVP